MLNKIFIAASYHSGAPAAVLDTEQPDLPEAFQADADWPSEQIEACSAAVPAESTTHTNFELFKSNVCHRLKALGDSNFVIEILEEDSIRQYYKEGACPESFYLLGMLDYLSRVDGIPLCTAYDDLRQYRLADPLYPAGILCLCHTVKSDEPKRQALREAIPEFLRFNIVECEVRDVV